MKYVIAVVALALVIPFASQAANVTDSVSIAPVSVACDATTANVTVNATYRENNRHLVLTVNGQKIKHWNNEPSSVTQAVSLNAGNNRIVAEIYLIEINQDIFVGRLARTTQNVTVSPCVPPVDDEEPVVDEDPSDTDTAVIQPVFHQGTSIWQRYFNLTGTRLDETTNVNDAIRMVDEVIKAKIAELKANVSTPEVN